VGRRQVGEVGGAGAAPGCPVIRRLRDQKVLRLSRAQGPEVMQAPLLWLLARGTVATVRTAMPCGVALTAHELGCGQVFKTREACRGIGSIRAWASPFKVSTFLRCRHDVNERPSQLPPARRPPRLGDVCERCSEKSPLSVMGRGPLERGWGPDPLDVWEERTAKKRDCSIGAGFALDWAGLFGFYGGGTLIGEEEPSMFGPGASPFKVTRDSIL